MNRAALALILLVVVLAGCSMVPLRTAPAPAAACDMALASGQLLINRPNGLALRAPNGDGILVLWPFGYSSRGFVGSMELVHETGRVIPREGDFVEMAGGTGADGVFVACAGTIRLVPSPG